MNTINSNTLNIGAGLGGGSNQVLISNTIGSSRGDTLNLKTGLSVRGNAEIDGTLTVGGQNITKTIDERLSAIEERLSIFKVDEELANRWSKLSELRKQYRELEQECWEKEEIVRILRK